jgi:hypothetical protein
MIEGTLDRMRKFSEQNGLNIDPDLLKQLIEESFWVNIIGHRGQATATNVGPKSLRPRPSAAPPHDRPNAVRSYKRPTPARQIGPKTQPRRNLKAS